MHTYGQKIIEEYQRNNTESTQEQQKQQPSASSSKKKVVRKKRHFHPETKREILKPYFGPEIVIDHEHSIVAKPMDDSTRPQYKNPKMFQIKEEYPDCSSSDSESDKEQDKSKKKERLL